MDIQQIIAPSVLLLTGLSGAGKTTVAKALANRLRLTNINPVLLDGDEIRTAVQVTGFDEASRKKYNSSVGALAALLESQGHTVIIALIAPYADVRAAMRKMCNTFTEIYLSADITTCMKRDPKGLYRKALNGEINEFTGISAPYEAPQNPELNLNTGLLSTDECVAAIMNYLYNEKK